MADLPLIASCEGCSGCCRGRSVPPFTGNDDPEFLALPTLLQEELLARMQTMPRAADQDDESHCLWLNLDTGRCTHYEYRPAACREFERGSFYCLMFRRKWNVPLPGLAQD